MSEHTKGRLSADSFHIRKESVPELTIAMAGNFRTVENCDNARRLAACWNACEGLATEQLEALPEPFSGLVLGDFLATCQELLAARAQNEKLTAMVQQQDALLGKKACAAKECRELLAARVLLREVSGENPDFVPRVISQELADRIRSYLRHQ